MASKLDLRYSEDPVRVKVEERLEAHLKYREKLDNPDELRKAAVRGFNPQLTAHAVAESDEIIEFYQDLLELL